MAIENLTIKEVREIVAMFSAGAVTPAPAVKPHPFVGQYVILRCRDAGVHAGYLESMTGDEAILRDSRRLWSWVAKDGVALSGLAVHGLKSGKVDTALQYIGLTGVIEVIPCSMTTKESIYDAK